MSNDCKDTLQIQKNTNIKKTEKSLAHHMALMALRRSLVHKSRSRSRSASDGHRNLVNAIAPDHRGSTGPAEPLLRTTTTTNMAAANFVVKTNN